MDENVIIGKGSEYPFEGILSLPNDISQRIPATMLVHGSRHNARIS